MSSERPPLLADSQSVGELRGEAYPNSTFALRAATVLALTGFVNGTESKLQSLGILVATVVVAALLGIFLPQWSPWIVLAPFAFVLVCVAIGILAVPNKIGLNDRFKAGSVTRVLVADGVITIRMNELYINRWLDLLIDVRRFGDIGALQFGALERKSLSTHRWVVLPYDAIPAKLTELGVARRKQILRR